MFNLIIYGNGELFGEPQPWTINEARFLEQSCEDARDEFKSRQSLKRLEQLPTLVTGEWGRDTDQIVRYGRVSDVRRLGQKLQFRFDETAHGTQDLLDDFQKELQLGNWEQSRSHWAVKQGDFPAELLASLSRGTYKEFPYEIVITYASENSEYVEAVAKELEFKGVRIFYAPFEKADLWGKSLEEQLDVIYRNLGRYCLMFISEHYAKKVWPNFERTVAMERAVQENDQYILPCRFDDTPLPGMAEDVVYQDLEGMPSGDLVELVMEKLRRKRR